jgi:hypothetical protein
MSARTLFDGKFDEYFANTGGDNTLWMLVHVPKTAGSSLVMEMQRILQPHYTIFWRNKSEPYLRNLEYELQTFMVAAAGKPYKFVSGHISGDQAQRVRETFPQTRSFAFLRQPVARAVSGYRYRRTDAHGPAEKFRQTYQSFAGYIEQGYIANRMALHLVPKRITDTGKWEDSYEFIEKNYDFIGLQEAYALSFRVVTTLIGFPRRATEHRRVTVDTKENTAELTPALDATIREMNTIDLPIFQEVQRKMSAIRGDLINYLNSAAPIAKMPKTLPQNQP